MFLRITRKKESKGGRKEKEKKDIFAQLRMIHACWMLWLVTVVFTFIISPYTFFIYQMPGAFIITPVTVGLSIYFGNKLGDKLGNKIKAKFFEGEDNIGAQVLWITSLSLFLFPIILLMDLASVASESYYNGMITQYLLYWASVTLLMLLTFLLLFSVREPLLLSIRKRGGET